MQKTVTSTDNREVAGSSPASLTGIAQLDRVPIVCLRISLFVIQKKRVLQDTVTSIGLNFDARQGLRVRVP